MRGLRSTIALLVVLAGLGAYIYFVTWKLPDEDAKTEEKVFATLEADKIEALQVTSDKGETTTLAKTGGAWQVTAPEAVKAIENMYGLMIGWIRDHLGAGA